MKDHFKKQVWNILKTMSKKIWAIVVGAGVILSSAAALDYFFKIKWWYTLLGLIILGFFIIIIAPITAIISNLMDKSRTAKENKELKIELKKLKNENRRLKNGK